MILGTDIRAEPDPDREPDTSSEMLDEALEETFPASDPPAVILPREEEAERQTADQERAGKPR